MYSLHSEMVQLAKLSPYGQKGIQSWAAYDDIRGGVCGRVRNAAEDVLQDKSKLFEYLKGKYVCTGSTCVER
jgi:hypothetical protein